MNSDAIKKLVLAVREDWKIMSNPFTWLLGGHPSVGFIIHSIIEDASILSYRRDIQGLAIAYDVWMDLWPDSWDKDLFPAVLDEFVPFAEDVSGLLALGKLTTAREVANLVMAQPRQPISTSIIMSETPDQFLCRDFHYLVEDLVKDHEQTLTELENLEVKERLDEIRGAGQ